MKARIENYHREVREVDTFFRAKPSGYGQYKVIMTATYNGVDKDFITITNDMPFIDELKEKEGEEYQSAMFEKFFLDDYEEVVSEWIEDYEENHIVINEIVNKAMELGIEIETYTAKNTNIKSVQSLHTDNCDFVGFGICASTDSEILDWAVIPHEDYNKNLYANCGKIEEKDIIVVLVS